MEFQLVRDGKATPILVEAQAFEGVKKIAEAVAGDICLVTDVKPEIRDVTQRQSPKPRGAKRGASRRPTRASKLALLSVTTLRRGSKVCRNQMTIVARKITVKARCRKSRAFSQRRRPTFFRDGRR